DAAGPMGGRRRSARPRPEAPPYWRPRSAHAARPAARGDRVSRGEALARLGGDHRADARAPAPEFRRSPTPRDRARPGARRSELGERDYHPGTETWRPASDFFAPPCLPGDPRTFR